MLKGATLVELEPAKVERADLRIAGGRIVERSEAITAQPDDESIDVTGRLVMPGLVSAHHHLSSVLLRGAPRPAAGFAGEQSVKARLGVALTADDVEAAAAAGALEGLAVGTTTVFDTQLSPDAEALLRAARGLGGVGLRAVLAQPVSDEAGLEVGASYARRARGRFRGGLALGDVSRAAGAWLRVLHEAARVGERLALVSLGEDRDEEARSEAAFGQAPVQRLLEAGLIGESTVVSQGVHLSWPELSALISHGAWVVHTARSNMASQTGHATPSKFGVRGTVGTDVLALDVLAEAQAAALRAADSGLPIDVLRFLANGHRLASAAFGVPVGPLREGAVADLLVLDYQPPTPLDATTLAAHLTFGLAGRHVESVMVDGLWRLWKRKALGVDAAEVARAASEAARAAWSRMADSG